MRAHVAAPVRTVLLVLLAVAGIAIQAAGRDGGAGAIERGAEGQRPGEGPRRNAPS